MTVALLSDVHGNLPSLEACLAAVEDIGCSDIYCLGDTFGYLPDGQACFDLLQGRGARMLLGNHEAMLLGRLDTTPERESIYQLDAQRRDLDPGTRSAIDDLLPFMELVIAGRRLLLVHGTPADPLRGYAFPDGDHDWMGDLPYDYVVMGNTHRAFTRNVGSVQITNVGSVGLPRDQGGSASFGAFDERTGEVSLHRVPIDVDRVRSTYATAHPKVLAVFDRRSTS